MTLQRQHHPVASLHSRFQKRISSAAALLPDISECENMLLILRIAPDQGALIRRLLRNRIHHVIAEIEIIRPVRLNVCQAAVFIYRFLKKVLCNTHKLLLPKARNLS